MDEGADTGAVMRLFKGGVGGYGVRMRHCKTTGEESDLLNSCC